MGATCGGGWGILAHGRRRQVVKRRIISARVLVMRRRGPCAIGCCAWSVVRPAAGDMFYRVLPHAFQSDALVVVVVCRVVDWWRKDWWRCLIRRKLTVVRSRVDGITFRAGLRA